MKGIQIQAGRTLRGSGTRRRGVGLVASAVGLSMLAGCAQALPVATPSTTKGTPTPTAAGSCQEAAAKLTPPERAGMVVLVGLTGAPDAATTDVIARARLGGVVLIGPFKTGVAGVKGIAGPLAKSGLLVAASQEGGSFQSLTGPGFDTIPPAGKQPVNDAATMKADWATWGGQLKDAGVHLNLAPSADVLSESVKVATPPGDWEDRLFGTDPGVVSGIVTTAIAGLQQGGVAASATHFPGMGYLAGVGAATTAQPDTVTRTTSQSVEPYRYAASAGVDVITVSTANFSNFDDASPAAFSAKVMTLLRDDVKFGGVIASEDLTSKSETLTAVPSAERLLRFVRAGGDLAVVSDPVQADVMVKTLAVAAVSDKLVGARLLEASASVLGLRAKAGLATCTPVKG